jgi:DNA-binding transcriptional regulator YdaS (Cro superfamily)
MTLDQAVEYFGTKLRVAAALGVTRQAVSSWREVPPLRQLQLERMTRGALRADDDILDRPRQVA